MGPWSAPAVRIFCCNIRPFPRQNIGTVSRVLLALVEIGDDPMLLLIAGVFILTFVAVGTLAYLLIGNRRSDGPATTWQFQIQRRLPVSKRTFELISRATHAGMERPSISPQTRVQLDRLDQARGVFVSIYRVLMIGVGLAGLTGGVLLLRSHTPANMNGLPGAIVLLFSLGALLKGLVPDPSIRPSVEPLEPGLLEQFKRKINVQVSTLQPLRVTLSEADMRRAAEMLDRGVPIADVARAVHAEYEGLSDHDRRSVEAVIAQASGASDAAGDPVSNQ